MKQRNGNETCRETRGGKGKNEMNKSKPKKNEVNDGDGHFQTRKGSNEWNGQIERK